MQQFFECLTGLAPGPGLQILTQPDEGDQPGRGFKENIPELSEQAEESQHRVTPGRAGAEGDQYIHVAALVPEGRPGAAVEGQACTELDDGGQDQVEPADATVVVQGHGGHDRQRKQQREQEPVALTEQFIVGGLF